MWGEGEARGYPGSVLGDPDSVLGYPGSVQGYPGSVLGDPDLRVVPGGHEQLRAGALLRPLLGVVLPDRSRQAQ